MQRILGGPSLNGSPSKKAHASKTVPTRRYLVNFHANGPLISLKVLERNARDALKAEQKRDAQKLQTLQPSQADVSASDSEEYVHRRRKDDQYDVNDPFIDDSGVESGGDGDNEDLRFLVHGGRTIADSIASSGVGLDVRRAELALGPVDIVPIKKKKMIKTKKKMSTTSTSDKNVNGNAIKKERKERKKPEGSLSGELLRITNDILSLYKKEYHEDFADFMAVKRGEAIKPKSTTSTVTTPVDPMIDEDDADPDCYICNKSDKDALLVYCEVCDLGACHTFCFDPPLDAVPEGEWYCPSCTKKRAAGNDTAEVASPSTPTTTAATPTGAITASSSVPATGGTEKKIKQKRIGKVPAKFDTLFLALANELKDVPDRAPQRFHLWKALDEGLPWKLSTLKRKVKEVKKQDDNENKEELFKKKLQAFKLAVHADVAVFRTKDKDPSKYKAPWDSLGGMLDQVLKLFKDSLYISMPDLNKKQLDEEKTQLWKVIREYWPADFPVNIGSLTRAVKRFRSKQAEEQKNEPTPIPEATKKKVEKKKTAPKKRKQPDTDAADKNDTKMKKQPVTKKTKTSKTTTTKASAAASSSAAAKNATFTRKLKPSEYPKKSAHFVKLPPKPWDKEHFQATTLVAAAALLAQQDEETE